jgi:hypothetical protein
MRTVLYGSFGNTKEIPATDLRIKANIELAKLMNCYERPEGDDQPGRGRTSITINLGFLKLGRAEAILTRQSRSPRYEEICSAGTV